MRHSGILSAVLALIIAAVFLCIGGAGPAFADPSDPSGTSAPIAMPGGAPSDSSAPEASLLDPTKRNDANASSDSSSSFYDSSSETSSSGKISSNYRTGSSTAFFLVVVLCAFGYFLFSNYEINARIDKLAEQVNLHNEERDVDKLVPFSWNSVLRNLEGGIEILPNLRIARPGLVLLGAKSEDNSGLSVKEVIKALEVNCAGTVLYDPELSVIVASDFFVSDELGRSILSLEAGRDWRNLTNEERENVLRRHSRSLERYERSLFCLNELTVSPSKLFSCCRELLKECDIGAIVLDNLTLFSNDEGEEQADLLERLRLIAVRCHVPIMIIMDAETDAWKNIAESDYITACGIITAHAGNCFTAEFTKFPGAISECSWMYSAECGKLSDNERL